MSCCYILYSPSLNSFYTGMTQDFPERLKKHNLHLYGSTYTAKANDWEVFIIIGCNSLSQASLIEKHIKAMKSRTYIQNLKKYPEMVLKLLEKYSSSL